MAAILDRLVGKPLRTAALRTTGERAEQVGPAAGIPIFGLDVLSSAAYGPEAALRLLIPLGPAGVQYIIPVSAAIIALLVIVCFSYRQTIDAYPTGGGSYTVARYNLGAFWGLLAAAALLADYILTAAVGISAGVGLLISADPWLWPHTLFLCLAILAVITVVNLLGVKHAGTALLLPTCVFVGCLAIVIVGGIIRTLTSGGHPVAVSPLPPPPAPLAGVTFWLLLRVFSSGCTALTGIEAVSNGVKAFREPRIKNAQLTLTVNIAILAILLAGISYLVKVYGIVATDPGLFGYQSILSLLIAAVFGKGVFYYVAMGSILFVLSLSANTAFADFPRLCRAIAANNYLPHRFVQRGRGLVYTQGIVVLALLCGFLLVLFGGVTDRLIPLYAVGAFLAFTLSQAGMVRHWWKKRGPHWAKSALVNSLGALVTGITVIVVLVAKFTQGAWLTLLFIPVVLILFRTVRRHYHRIALVSRLSLPTETPPAFVSYSRDDSDFALRLAGDVKASGANVWLDKLEIAGGERWDRSVQEALTNCAQVLVVLSPSSVNSNNVLDEVSFALETQKKVIPVLYRECVIPLRLRRIQYLDFTTGYALGLKAVLKALGAGAVQPPQPIIPAATAVSKESQPEASAADERQSSAEQAQREEENKQLAEPARLEHQERERLAAAEKARREQEERGRLEQEHGGAPSA